MRSRLVLPAPFETEHEQPFAAAEVERDVLEHRRPAVRLAQMLGDATTVSPHGGGSGKRTVSVLVALGACDAFGLEPGDALLDAVRLRRLGGLGAEAVDEPLHPGDLLRLLGGLLGQSLLVVGPRR